MAAGDTARLYHRLTSSRYGPGLEWPEPGRPVPVGDPRMLADFVPLDMARLPAPCKAYPPGLAGRRAAARLGAGPRIGDLGPGRPARRTADRRSTCPASPGCSTCRPGWFGSWSVPIVAGCSARPGSAGGRFPLEVYLSSRGVAGLPDGVHWYDPIGHATDPGRAAGGWRSDDADRHRGPVADRLEIRGARTPSRVLGCRHDARADPCAGGFGRIPARACGRASPTPRSLVWSAPTASTSSRSRWSGLGDGEPAIRPAGEAVAWRRRRGADRVPARHAHAARG